VAIVKPESNLARHQEANSGAAGAALTFSLCACLLAAYLYPSRSVPSRSSGCILHLKELSVALQEYADDHEGTLPPADTWATAVQPYLKNANVFRCPRRQKDGFSYAFNSHLGGVVVDAVRSRDTVPLLFESSSDYENAKDPLTSFTAPHGDVGYVAFLDGRVEATQVAPEARFQVNPIQTK
jgi:hypothetical protein